MPRRVAQANAWIREASDQSRMNVQDGTGMADAQYAVGAFYYAGLGGTAGLYLRAGAAERAGCDGSTRMWTCSPFRAACPKFVVCDNLKAAVTNPYRYEPGLNRPKFFRLNLAKPSSVGRRSSISP